MSDAQIISVIITNYVERCEVCEDLDFEALRYLFKRYEAEKSMEAYAEANK